MFTINLQFERLVTEDKDLVLDHLRSDEDLVTMASMLGIVNGADDPLAAFLAEIPPEHQRTIKESVATVVEAGGPVYFDAWPAGVGEPWDVMPYLFDDSTDPADGMVLVLVGPWELVPMLS
jgi:hypothetical protein